MSDDDEVISFPGMAISKSFLRSLRLAAGQVPGPGEPFEICASCGDPIKPEAIKQTADGRLCPQCWRLGGYWAKPEEGG